MENPDIDLVESTFIMNDLTKLICDGVAVFLQLDDSTELTVGDIRPTMESLTTVIAGQQKLINQSTEHAFRVKDAIEAAIAKSQE